MALGGALQVRLVDDRLLQRHLGLGDPAPVEPVLDDHRAPVVIPVALRKTAGVRVEQQRLRIERVAGAVRSAGVNSVAGARLQQRRGHLPHPTGSALERHLLGHPVQIRLVEGRRQLDGGCVLRPDAQRRRTVVQSYAEIVEDGASGRSEMGHVYSVEARSRGELKDAVLPRPCGDDSAAPRGARGVACGLRARRQRVIDARRGSGCAAPARGLARTRGRRARDRSDRDRR